MYKAIIWALLLCSLTISVSGSAPFRFENPVKSDELPCSELNLNRNKLDQAFSTAESVEICDALESELFQKRRVSNWSPAVSVELQQIWTSFSSENVTIAPMPSKMSGRIAAAVKSVLPSGNGKIKTTLFLRPEKTGSSRFFLTLMHELKARA